MDKLVDAAYFVGALGGVMLITPWFARGLFAYIDWVFNIGKRK